ncbi:cytosolic carboxypeptidase 3 isoform X2 [Hyla sarda]|nr:cytosolic carboxypeptidase 3 isoform X2 [Hyla sarda]XP_056373677.1 cytosolic carboxypeptidase 3 isoform X2 [Hyla sarda]
MSAITCRGVMSDDTEIQDIVADQTSSSDSELEEDTYESEDPDTYDFYSGNSALYLYTQKTNQIVYEYHSGRKVARLREPRDLYGVSSNSFFHLPRWPYECQVLKGKIEHIEWDPPVPEPMYKSLGLEREPTCFNPIKSKVIYELSEGWKESYFMCSRVGGNRSPLEPVSLRRCEESDNTLVFESRFESGNLQKVIQVGDYDYQLTLRTDLYTDRHTQWYYFRVKNTRAGVPYRFTITNFMKPTSLYNQGMRPLMYSEIDADSQQVGWRRIGDEIKYYRNGSGRGGQTHYSLSWTFTFPHSGDTCYFAHCYPYTYSNLQDYLARIANDPERSRYCKIRVLCHSLAGNIVYVLTITNPTAATKDPKKKKAIILTARVHPGESNSSWMMKGFLDYILSSRSDARLLRDTFVFKVVPMLNPDGVIVGNYRCSLSGRDLNRNYKSRLKDSFPSTWFTRNMIKRVMEEREILLYCDLHGHSRKQNVFMYGCKSSDSHLCERIFPLMLSRISPDKFSFSGCKFKVQKSKEGTGRVVMWKMGIRNSYTLEATFCGSSLGNRCGTHFSTKDLESLGYHFCDALLDYCDPEKTKFSSFLSDLEEMNFNHRLGLDSESLLGDVLSDLDSSTRGSDSSDSNGPPAHLMELACKVKPRRKILKSKRERNSQRKTSERIHDLQEEDENQREKPRAVIVERRVSAETAETVKPYKSVIESGAEKNACLGWTSHDRQKVKLGSVRKLQNLPRASKKNRISKQQQALLSEDLGAKKVSVIYLMFNAKGEVITTKSHARNKGVAEITSAFNSFNWKRPLFSHFLSQRCLFSRILEPCCYYISPDIPDSFRPNTANDGSEHDPEDKAHKSENVSFSSPLDEQPSICCSKQLVWSGELYLKQKTKGRARPPPARVTESAPPALPPAVLKAPDQAGNFVRRKSKKMEACSFSAPQNSAVGNQKGNNIDHLTCEKEETLLPAVAATREASLMGADSLYTAAASKLGAVSIPHTSYKSSASTGALPPAKVRGQCGVYSGKGTLQKRKLGKLIGPRLQEDRVSTHHANLPANTWKDVLVGLQTGEGGGSVESITLHRGADHPIPTPPKGHFLKNGTCYGFVGRKPGQRVSLVPLPKTVPSSQ